MSRCTLELITDPQRESQRRARRRCLAQGVVYLTFNLEMIDLQERQEGAADLQGKQARRCLAKNAPMMSPGRRQDGLSGAEGVG